MKGITLATLMVVGILAFAAAAIGLSYAKYDEATTTVFLGDGITCTVDGKEVANGDTVTTQVKGGYISVHAESSVPAVIGYSGMWTCGDKSCTDGNKTDSEVTSYDYKIAFNHGKFSGRMSIKNMGDDQLQPIELKFSVDESKLTVMHGGDVIHDGDVFTLVSDDAFTVSTVDGQKHTINWDGHWSNPDGEKSGASGCHYATSTTITIQDFIYFSKATGTMVITMTE